MDTSGLLATLHRELEALRAEYIANGRGDEFDAYVEHLRTEGRWPFEEDGVAGE
jgi:hypothetical protein